MLVIDAPDPTIPGGRGDALDVLVIGAGQAGLAIAYHLRRAGLRFLVVDGATELGASWRDRWDSLTLFTPAQYDALPGLAFPAPAHTYPTKDQVADYLRSYAATYELPVLLGTRVTALRRAGDRFAAHTTQGVLQARQVVVATGPFQAPVVPAYGAAIDGSVTQLHSAAYRNPTDIPAGPVVVVGAGNSGRQIALELAATHDVTLAVGTRSVQLPQRLLGRDLFWWLTALGVIDKTGSSLLAKRMRARGDLVIGSRLHELAGAGVTVRPRMTAASADTVTFADSTVLRASSIVWATGFRSDYSWIEVPAVVVDGRVEHTRGITPEPGLSFIGLPWQHTRGSALLGFVKDDAAWLAEQILATQATTRVTHPSGGTSGVRISRSER